MMQFTTQYTGSPDIPTMAVSLVPPLTECNI